MAKISTAIINECGESGSPCLTPLSKGKCPVVNPLFITALDTSLYSIRIQCMKEGPKLNLCKVLIKKLNSSVSKAFSKSITNKMPGKQLRFV